MGNLSGNEPKHEQFPGLTNGFGGRGRAEPIDHHAITREYDAWVAAIEARELETSSMDDVQNSDDRLSSGINTPLVPMVEHEILQTPIGGSAKLADSTAVVRHVHIPYLYSD